MSENAEYELTDEQKKKALEAWNEDHDISLKKITEAVFGPEVDSRSKLGRSLREFLASRDIKARPAQVYKKKGFLELSDEDKEFLANTASTMTALEQARQLFKNELITQTDQETRTVYDFRKTLDPKILYKNGTDDDVPTDYKPPGTESRALGKVRQYVDNNGIDETKMTAQQKKCLKILISYLNTYRFLSIINSYVSNGDKNLFESEFVRCVWDKPDLTQEEVDQYIMYAAEVVSNKTINSRINMLEEEQNKLIKEGKNFSMTLVDAIKSLREEHSKSVNTQNKILGELKTTRSKRMEKLVQNNASILNFFTAWKEEESRKKMISYARFKEEKVKDEIKRFNSMEQIKAQIFGIDPNEFGIDPSELSDERQ